MDQRVDAALRALMSHGFAFRYAPGDDHVDRTLLGKRPQGTHDDFIHIRGERDCLAARMRAAAQPSEADVVWSYYGPFLDAVGELLSLPLPGDRFAPSLAARAAGTLWLPGR